MKVLLDIKDEKVPFVMEMLKNFKFLKAAPLTEKEEILDDIKQAVDEMKLIKAGKKQARNAEDFIHELQGQDH